MLKHKVGRCSFILLILEVKMQKANPLTDKGRMKTTVPVMFIKLDHAFYKVLNMVEERKLIKQVNVTGKSELIIDNPEIDNKPNLLYNDNNNEEVPVIKDEMETIKNDKTDKFLEKKLHKLWDLLGTPSGKRKAILGKPNIDKEKLLEDLQQEVKKINNDKPNNSKSKSEPDRQKLFFIGGQIILFASHSKLKMADSCLFVYKKCYIDKVKRSQSRPGRIGSGFHRFAYLYGSNCIKEGVQSNISIIPDLVKKAVYTGDFSGEVMGSDIYTVVLKLAQ